MADSFDAVITAIKGATGNVVGRDDKLKKAREILKLAIDFAEDQIPGVKVVAMLEGKVVGNPDALVEVYAPIVKHLDAIAADKVYVDGPEELVALFAPVLGDEEPNKKAAKSAWNA